MHVPPSSGPHGDSPGTPGEPEILTGPADEPKKPRRSRKSPRRSGAAIAVFSVLAVALLGGGAAFALLNGTDDGGTPGRSPDSAQQASRSPVDEPGQARKPAHQEPGDTGDADGTDGTDDAGDTGDAGGADDAGTASGGDDTSTGSGGSDTGESGSDTDPDSAAGTPSRERPAKEAPARQRQNAPASPPAQENPWSDGDTGYVHPQGPAGR
ncbi:hypothetical protein ACIBCT_20565 [Streptosporangium sp. NPDC050855]|uniref:hypothetical protein n=1 Tax=Streptosporangium sp. NPDC050855 TaxID=3366194 RepID=UPI0037BC815B